MSLSGILAGALGATSGLSNINGSSGYSNATDISNSYGYSDNSSWSYGQSANSAYTNMDAWSQAQQYMDSWNEGGSQGWSQSDAYGESGGRTYGREASAQDVLNAAAANQMQMDLWSLQAAYNSKEAQLSRQWSKQMQDTYYQRLVDDLKKSGLNPILALSGYGSSAPVGATASTGLASAAKANAYAESENYGYNRSSSRSEDYSWNRGGSHSEGYSKSQSTERSRSSGSSSNSGGSSGHSENSSGSFGNSHSETTNNIKEIGQSAINATKGITKNIVGALSNYYTRTQRSSWGSHSFR